LADLRSGDIDDVRWRETEQGVVMTSGDAKLVLQGVTADEVALDLLFFTGNTLADTLGIFDLGAGGGVLGTALKSDDLNGTTHSDYLTITMSDLIDFDTWGGDLLGFASADSGSPNILGPAGGIVPGLPRP